MTVVAVAPTTEAAGTPTGPAIRAEKLIKEFGRRRVVDGVNLTVAPGEIVGLLGPNGAGKTTTFYMIVGLVPVGAGRVFLGDRDLTDQPMHRRARLGLGYLPQEASVFRRLTVEQNLIAVAETLKLTRRERQAQVEASLEELHLTKVRKQMAYTLSGGERRRLEIARALITSPRFLLLDEPFSGVDPINVAEVQNIVRQLKHRGLGVLITDHNVRETLSIVDRAYLMHEGRVLAEGSRDFLLLDEKARRFYLGENFSM